MICKRTPHGSAFDRCSGGLGVPQRQLKARRRRIRLQ
jgi:hypothetical protein